MYFKTPFQSETPLKITKEFHLQSVFINISNPPDYPSD